MMANRNKITTQMQETLRCPILINLVVGGYWLMLMKERRPQNQHELEMLQYTYTAGLDFKYLKSEQYSLEVSFLTSDTRTTFLHSCYCLRKCERALTFDLFGEHTPV